MAGFLKNVVDRTFQQSGKITFSEEPTIERKDIIEYDHRMRASGLDKFNYPAFVAAVNFYKTQKDEQEHNACGAVVFYIKASMVEQILKAVGIRGFDEDEDESVAGKCAEFCLALTEEFKKELMNAGYANLIMSQPICAKNNIFQGVEFSYDQYDRFELSYSHSKQKVLVLDLTMANLPRH